MSNFRLFGRHAALSLALASALACTARADTVTEWNRIMQETVTVLGDTGGIPNSNPNHQTRWGAIVQLAVFEAVNSIDQSYEPYIAYLDASPNASLDAAVITAAHDTLVALRPNSAVALGLRRDMDLAAITPGPAKEAGIAVGAAAAVAMLALRADDGWNDIVPYVEEADTGVWQPIGTQTPVLPGWGLVTPFGIESGSQYRLPAPPALHTEKYAAAYNEVKLLGKAGVNPFRPQDRTDVANFYANASPVYVFNMAARQVSTLSLTENARVFALLAMAMADASVAAWDTKYHYNFWRPQAAIQNGDFDGNPLTEADPTWLPLIPTPAHPSYASGHATVSGSARAVLEWAFGKDGHEVTLTHPHPSVTGVVLTYTAWDEITDDVDDARIYGGIHFSFDQEKGAHQGRQVGKYILKNLLPPADEVEDEE